MREINLVVKKDYNEITIKKLLYAGLKNNFIYSEFCEGTFEEMFRPISITQAIRALIIGNKEEIRAIHIKIEDTYIPILILENNENANEILIMVTGLPLFWSKQFLNTQPSDGHEADFPRYTRALLRWLKDFDIANFVFQKDFEDRVKTVFVGDETRFICVDVDLTYPNFEDNLKHFYTNSLIHGHEFTDSNYNKLEFDQIKKTIETDLSIELYFTAQEHGIELYLSEYQIHLKPLEPFKKKSKDNDGELLIDWPFYIEVILRLTEGFWINDFRIIQPDEYR